MSTVPKTGRGPSPFHPHRKAEDKHRVYAWITALVLIALMGLLFWLAVISPMPPGVDHGNWMMP